VVCALCNTESPTVAIFSAGVDASTPMVGKLDISPVETLESLFKSRVRWEGKPPIPIHVRLLDGLTHGSKVGDTEWMLMMAQLLREREMGLRTDKELQELASYILGAGKAVSSGTNESLELLLALGAHPPTEEKTREIDEAARDRRDGGYFRRRLYEEGRVSSPLHSDPP
jgi:hypothetical protein